MKKIKALVYGFSTLSLFGLLVNATHATADADLGIALASTTAMIDDNKSQIMLYFVSVSLVVLILLVAKRSIMWGIAKIAGAIGGRRRRR